MPEAVEKQRVQFAGSSFFDPLPPFRKIPDVFLLRHILHDWSDKYATLILRALVPAFKDGARIVIQDTLMPEPGEMALWKEKNMRSVKTKWSGGFVMGMR